jgi:hypothetical protein
MFSRNEINTQAPPPRRHYPWHEMEEYQPDGGMWSIPSLHDRQRFIHAAEALMVNPEAFRDSMRLALDQWPRSASVALTTPGMNHRAWLGHAGCYLATGSPEETTRLGWHLLDEGEQMMANETADTVIHEWKLSEAAMSPQAALWGMVPSLSRWRHPSGEPEATQIGREGQPSA